MQKERTLPHDLWQNCEQNLEMLRAFFSNHDTFYYSKIEAQVYERFQIQIGKSGDFRLFRPSRICLDFVTNYGQVFGRQCLQRLNSAATHSKEAKCDFFFYCDT